MNEQKLTIEQIKEILREWIRVEEQDTLEKGYKKRLFLLGEIYKVFQEGLDDRKLE